MKEAPAFARMLRGFQDLQRRSPTFFAVVVGLGAGMLSSGVGGSSRKTAPGFRSENGISHFRVQGAGVSRIGKWGQTGRREIMRDQELSPRQT